MLGDMLHRGLEDTTLCIKYFERTNYAITRKNHRTLAVVSCAKIILLIFVDVYMRNVD